MRLLLQFAVLLIMFWGCASKNQKLFDKEENHNDRNKELMKSFKVDEEVLVKFVEKNNESSSNDQVTEKVASPEKKVDPPKMKKGQPVRKDIKPDQNKYKQLQKISENKESQQGQYPEDYPEEFIKISKDAQELWKNYKPIVNIGEETALDINYLGVSTGKIILKTKEMTELAGKQAYHMNARLKTSRYYSYLYELDDNIDSYIAKESFLPLKYSLIQRESGQDVDDLQLFDWENFTTYTFYQRKTSKKEKKSKSQKYIPRYFQDPLSVIHFLRGLPMHEDAKYDIPVVNKGKVNIMHFKVLEKEMLDTAIGKKEAWKVMANTEYSGDRLKKGNMYFWFTTDDKRIFLKFNAKISIGSISGDIESYDP